MGADSFRPYATRFVDRVSLDGNPAYYKFASRETCIARDQPWIYYLVDHGCEGYVDLPHLKTYDYYIEEASSMRFFRDFANGIEKNWEGHLTRFEPAKKSLLKEAKALSATTSTDDSETILIAYRRFPKWRTITANSFGRLGPSSTASSRKWYRLFLPA